MKGPLYGGTSSTEEHDFELLPYSNLSHRATSFVEELSP